MGINSPREIQSHKDKISLVESGPQEQGFLSPGHGTCVLSRLPIPTTGLVYSWQVSMPGWAEKQCLLYVSLVLHVRWWDVLAGLSPTDSKQGGGNSSKFSHMVLSPFQWKSRAKINFILVLSLLFLLGRSIFSLEEQFATFLFFASTGR